jgi:transcriptional regulator with XRE-family HTH domain
MTLLAININGFRKRKKMTQDQLARACKVSNAAVSQWESIKNPTTPELETVLNIAKLFGTTIEHLMESTNIDIGPEAGEELSSRLLTRVFTTLTQTEGLTNFFDESNLTRKANLFKALYTLYSGLAIDQSLSDIQLMKYVGLEEAMPMTIKKNNKKK